MFFNRELVFNVNDVRQFNINKLEFYLKYTGNVWDLSYRYLDEYREYEIKTIEDFPVFNTEKWVFEKEYARIIIKPALPDKPVLTDFRNPTSVLPGESINLYEQILSFVDIMLISDQKEVSIKRLPTIPTLLTWLGDPMDGETCYHDESEAVFNKQLIDYQHGAIICPIHIDNKSDRVYDLKQMVIRTEFLSIYDHKDKLWSDKMKINYMGENKENPLEIVSDFNSNDKYTRLSAPREDAKQNNRLLKRLCNIRSFMS
jgi:hypothetical protein